MSLNAATAAPSGHFLVSRKKPSVIAQTHLISVSLKICRIQTPGTLRDALAPGAFLCEFVVERGSKNTV
jgi:hypothetical protein